MDIEQILRDKTYKGDGQSVARRVHATLTHESSTSCTGLTANRTMRLLCLLIEHLVDQERLSEAEVDAMLLDLVS